MPIIKLNNERACPESFFQDYLECTKGGECPADFHLWTAVGTVATALGRNVWLPRGHFRVYPNLFMVLIGESALTHKNTALGIGCGFLREALGDRLSRFSQKITTEGLIYHLSERCKEVNESVALIYAPEFSVFFGKSITDPTLIQTLTDLFDCPDVWSYTTRGRGIESCEKVCINMMAGSTPEWIKSCMPEEAIGGGFFSRLIPVFRAPSGVKEPFPEDVFMDSAILKLRENCISDICSISLLRGPFRWSPAAKSAYGDWYRNFFKPEDEPGNLRSYYGRKGDKVLKIAMICSAAKGSSLELTEGDIEFAISTLADNEKYMVNVAAVMGQTEGGRSTEKVLKIIQKNKRITRSKLLQNVSHYLDSRMLDEIMDTLIKAEQVKIFIPAGTRSVVYEIQGGIQ